MKSSSSKTIKLEDQDVTFLRVGDKMGYSFERNGTKYGNFIRVEGLGIKESEEMLEVLKINALSTLKGLRKK